MGILWTIIIGFVAGVIAKFIMPGDNEPTGFILTAILGIVGAFVATFLGQALGWYQPGEGAGLIGAVVGAVVVLLVYGMVAGVDARFKRRLSAQVGALSHRCHGSLVRVATNARDSVFFGRNRPTALEDRSNELSARLY